MLKSAKEDRSLKENLMLASSTAFVSGAINVACVIAFLAFTSNITGHVATLAKHLVEQNMAEFIVFLLWLGMFFIGAFISTFIIRSLEHKSHYLAHAVPIMLEILVLLFVAVYGHNFYKETQTEREIVIGAILFAMGLQNSMVSTLSGGLIKTSHLTGLFTDLGAEISDWLHPTVPKTVGLQNKITIRVTILICYFLGAVAGGILFNWLGFLIFYFIPVILLAILYYDISPIALHKLSGTFSPAKNVMRRSE